MLFRVSPESHLHGITLTVQPLPWNMAKSFETVVKTIENKSEDSETFFVVLK